MVRYRLLVGLIVLMVLGACGAGTPATQHTPEAPASNRLIKHALGETQVPANPRRVVVLDNGALDNALALGVKPIGAATVFDDGQFLPYLKDQAAGITPVGTIDQPNLEAILAAKPDLILGSKDVHEGIYDQLSQIAPTVLVAELGATWKANLRLQAEALGKTSAAEALLTGYQKQIDELKQALGDQLSSTQVSVVRSMPDQLRIYMNASYIGTILRDAGLPRPPAQNQDKLLETISEELIPSLDGSVIFVAHRDPANSQLKTMQDNPLWANLSAVKEGRVYEVPHDIWINGLGIQSATRILADLQQHLTS